MSSITFQSRFFLRTIHCSMTSIVICLLILFSGSKANGQVDPHFSQYYMYPHWLNPALTGAINGNYRVGSYTGINGAVSQMPFRLSDCPGIWLRTKKSISVSISSGKPQGMQATAFWTESSPCLMQGSVLGGKERKSSRLGCKAVL